jgi:hypothetical protein
MTKKGDLLNQLALISDLVEKLNADMKSNTIVFEVSKLEFDRIYNYIDKKNNKKLETPKDRFTITIGVMDIVFSTNNA